MTKDKKKPKAVPLFTLYPAEIVLAKEHGGKRGSFTIRNNLPCSLAYKIKCTNPDAFKLRPVHGVLTSKGYVDIHLTLLTGAKYDNHEKFLILAAITDEEKLTPEELNELFKDAANIFGRHLQCVILCEGIEAGDTNVSATKTTDKINILESRLSTSMKIQIFISILICSCFFLILLRET